MSDSPPTLPALRQLVADVVAATDASPPALLDDNAVTLRAEPSQPFYLIGLIGGKDVGKSSLVNALVGQEIAIVTGYGEGTARVTAYAHRSIVAALEAQLQQDVPGQFVIIPHDEPGLKRQVLLDLPDIDSTYQSHIALTRSMLRRLLYPVWVQSIEKYADQRPQQMLAEVAAGNAAENFLFCLSKADQLREEKDAAELANDFARRIVKTLDGENANASVTKAALQKPLPNRDRSINVFIVSARQPDRFDLPALRSQLSQERSTATVQQSLARAGEQQQSTLRRWLADQQLGERAARADRLAEDARQSLHDRLGEPLAAAIAAVAHDPIQLAGLTQDSFARRIDRWPIVRLLDGVLSPAVVLAETLIRGRSAAAAVAQDRAAQIEPTLRPLASPLQAAMAQLRRSQPELAALYDDRRWWDDAAAADAVSTLRDRLAAAVVTQRSSMMDRLGKTVPGSGIIRWLATIGAALWFPLIQPVLAVFLNTSIVWSALALGRLVVTLLSGAALLQDATFLLIWYVVLWLLIRYRTRRRVASYFGNNGSAALELTGISLTWMDELLAPLDRRAATMRRLAERSTKQSASV